MDSLVQDMQPVMQLHKGDGDSHSLRTP